MRIVTRRLSSPRPSLPPIPCITSLINEKDHNHHHNQFLQATLSTRKFSRMLPELLKAPEKLDNTTTTTNNNNKDLPGYQNLNSQTSRDHHARDCNLKLASGGQDADRMKILSERPTSYGGIGPKSHKNKNNNNHQQAKTSARSNSITSTNTSQPNRKKRFSLTSGNFSHQFPISNDDPGEMLGGCCGGGGGDGADGLESGQRGDGPAVSDIIGSFGLFQLLVLLFSGLREGLVGYDALIMSLILQPESKFLCADNLPQAGLQYHQAQQQLTNGSRISSVGEFNHLIELENYYYDGNLSQVSESETWNETAQCYRSLDGGRTPLSSPLDGKPLECQSWIFVNETARLGPSLVAEWSLVCQYHWLIAFIESAYFFGLVTGNLTWGYYADKFGRRPAYLMAHTMSLVFGSLAVFMPSIYLFALCRFLSAFGSVGYNIIYSIQVELIGAKHRSFSTILNHMGWGLGVICIPLVDSLFNDYRPIIAVAPLLSLVMYPWAFWLPESSRWLMANGEYEQAHKELIRAAKFNGKMITPKLEKKIWELEQKVRLDKLRQLSLQSSEQGKRSYTLIFTTPKLLRDTLILAYLAFVGHLFYYVQTINFAYVKNLSTQANFITSGAGEWVSVVVGAILLKFCTRKTCMSLFLFVMASSFAFQSLIESDLIPELNTVSIITTNNGLGTLSSLLLVFIALIVNQEVYPTVVRQTGTSITNTIGELGSTLAPLVIQLSRIMGPWEANATYTILCTAGILFAQFLTKTDGIELPDT